MLRHAFGTEKKMVITQSYKITGKKSYPVETISIRSVMFTVVIVVALVLFIAAIVNVVLVAVIVIDNFTIAFVATVKVQHTIRLFMRQCKN